VGKKIRKRIIRKEMMSIEYEERRQEKGKIKKRERR
jgi:hypothetical protein